MAERTLSADVSLRLVDFARACRAAARAVALYPAGHRAVDDAVGRLTDVSRRAAGDGGLAIDVLPDGLRIGGVAPDRADAGVSELAALLHAQQIGGLTLHATADRESWQLLLGLLSRSPDDNRRDGGLARLWQTAGGPSIEVHAIDYAALLREAGFDGGAAGTLTRLLRAANDGLLQSVSLADLESIIAAVETGGGSAHAGDEGEAAGRALARLGALVLSRQADADPARIEAALARLAELTAHLPADGMRGLIATRGGTEPADNADAGGAAAVLDRLDEPGRARFVATALVSEGSATARLREAFEALVPADDRRRVAALAEPMLPETGATPADLPHLRQELDRMAVSYDDRDFVGSAYARELTQARGRAEDLETAKPDPPERIEAWLATVSDAALRALDLQVLLDLLAIAGQDDDQYAAIAMQAAARIDDLARVGLVAPALALAHALEAVRADGGPSALAADAALAHLRAGSLVGDLVPLVRRAAPDELDGIIDLIARLGPGVAPALAMALSRESDMATRERLRAVLAGFGAAGEQAVRALLSSDHPETRRNAALLLRDFGGAATVADLEGLLGDRDPRVRREALRALAVDDDPRAHACVMTALAAADRDGQRALVDELGLVRDARVAPLLAALASRWHQRALADAALRAIDLIGALGTAAPRASIEALTALLQATRWWTPRRARAVRVRAAEALAALAAIGTPEAAAALDAAATGGGAGAAEAREARARRPA